MPGRAGPRDLNRFSPEGSGACRPAPEGLDRFGSDTADKPGRDILPEGFADHPEATRRWMSLPPSHRQDYLKWIGEAKTQGTRDRRIAEMLRRLKTEG